jgi:hypothetical protein
MWLGNAEDGWRFLFITYSRVEVSGMRRIGLESVHDAAFIYLCNYSLWSFLVVWRWGIVRMRIDWVEYTCGTEGCGTYGVWNKSWWICKSGWLSSHEFIVCRRMRIWNDRGTMGDAWCDVWTCSVWIRCVLLCVIWYMMWCNAKTVLTGWYEAVKYCSELDIGIVDIERVMMRWFILVA